MKAKLSSVNASVNASSEPSDKTHVLSFQEVVPDPVPGEVMQPTQPRSSATFAMTATEAATYNFEAVYDIPLPKAG